MADIVHNRGFITRCAKVLALAIKADVSVAEKGSLPAPRTGHPVVHGRRSYVLGKSKHGVRRIVRTATVAGLTGVVVGANKASIAGAFDRGDLAFVAADFYMNTHLHVHFAVVDLKDS